jgi:hypothetical protein
MTVAHPISTPTVATDRTFRRRNAALLSELGTAIIQDASILDEIPEGAMLVLLPTNADRDFIESSIATGIDMIAKGHNVYFRHLAPGEWGIDYTQIAEQHDPDPSP